MDSSRLLFICTGAFVGLQEIVERRLGTNQRRIGFLPRADEQVAKMPDQPVYEALCQAETRDLVEFGMIPEFIGRFATVTVLHELSRQDLRGIVGDRTENSALKKQETLARLHGIELEFTPEALDAIVEESIALGTGARGLHRLIGRAVDPVDYRWPELAAEGVSKVIIGRECVEKGAAPELVKSGAKRRPRRLDEALRRESLASLPPAPRDLQKKISVEPSGATVTDTSSWGDERIWKELEALKADPLRWDEATGSARKWWEAFEKENHTRAALVFRVAEELCNRNATISDFFLAYVYSNTDNLQANLYYLDYMKLKETSKKPEKK